MKAIRFLLLSLPLAVGAGANPASALASSAPCAGPCIVSAPQGWEALVAKGVVAKELATNLGKVRNVIWPRWYARYGDGTIVTNRFRWYRNSDDVLNYFLGYPGSHDCDARVQGGGKWCTRYAQQFAIRHRGLVEIGGY